MSDSDSIDLFRRVCNDDADAQSELFDRYIRRLMGLVRSRLSSRFARRIDPEDIVQSAYRSFFARASDDRFVLENSGDLWRLLAAITMNKLNHQIVRNKAAKRSVDNEASRVIRPDESVAEYFENDADRGPTPEEAVALDEEIAWILRDMNDRQREMFELRLSGHTLIEIAEVVGCSERTVRRFFDERLKPMLLQRL